jgi:hypothetical protein
VIKRQLPDARDHLNAHGPAKPLIIDDDDDDDEGLDDDRDDEVGA